MSHEKIENLVPLADALTKDNQDRVYRDFLFKY